MVAAVVEMLQKMGVHYGQGNYLGNPVPIEHTIDSLDRDPINS